MKKGTKIALAVAAVMLIIGATLVNIARHSGENILDYFKGGANVTVNSGAIHIGGDQKGYTVCTSGEESFSAAEVKNLDLDWISGEVNVEPYDGKTVVIREEADRPLTEGQRMRWKLQSGTLSVLSCADGEKNVPEKILTVLIPRTLQLKSVDADSVSAPVTVSDLTVSGELDCDTTSGAVLVRGCVCGSFDTDTVSGAVTVEDCAVSGDMDCDTTSGMILVNGCACGAFDADTVTGAVKAEALAAAKGVDVDTGSGAVVMRALAAGGDVDVTTVSGAVELRFGRLPASVDVDTTSGAVTLAFPKGTSLDLDYDTTSGRLSGTISSAKGGLPVDVDTVSGSLTIEDN